MSGTILVVDNEQNFCRPFTDRLQQEGFQVLAASSSREALAFVKQEPLDLIVLEPALPETDGFEILRRVREQAQEVKVVVLTAHPTVERAREATALGVKEFLGKPFDLNRLLAIVVEEVGERSP